MDSASINLLCHTSINIKNAIVEEKVQRFEEGQHHTCVHGVLPENS